MKSRWKDIQAGRTGSQVSSRSSAEGQDDNHVLSSIYASPTVDTLESNPSSGRLVETSGVSPGHAFTPSRIDSAAGFSRPTFHSQSTPKKTPRVVSFSKGDSGSSRKHRDFQHEQDAMSVAVRTLDLTTRTAFEPLPPASVEEWHHICAEAERMRGSGSMRKRLSPSLQHLKLLHKVQGNTKIRQLSFSPSVGMDSDIFVHWDDDLDNEKKDGIEKKARRRHRNRRDGRYRSIDPIQAIMSVLPPTPPTLSQHKLRLPMRSDVGFPNASPEEIQQKQTEIAQETEWEEASPRLVVLVTGDDLGTAIQDSTPPDVLTEAHREWNGGGLEGMPLAGRELIIAKERNRRHFGGTRQSAPIGKKELLEPDQTSVLAPPLDSTFSSSLGWRPRPFHDHPPGTLHCLACPLQVDFDVGDIEPLIGSLTLYTLPVDGQMYRNGSPFGKTSEEFYFPVGNWTGRVDLDAARTVDGKIDDETVNAWFHRKHKALFSYDPYVLNCDEQQSLFVVLQIFKGAQRNPSAAYIAKGESATEGKSPFQKRRSIGRRIRSKLGKVTKAVMTGDEAPVDLVAAKAATGAIFDAFGTQFLSPLCFGVCPVNPSLCGDSPDEQKGSLESSEIQWPAGESQMIDLYSLPSYSESEDTFVERLLQIVSEDRTSATRSGEACEVRHTLAGGLRHDHSWPEGQFRLDRARPLATDALSSGDVSSSSLTDNSPTVRIPTTGKTSRNLKSQPTIRSPPPSDRSLKTRETSTSLEPSYLIAGSATLFTSRLGVDFTQSMLQTPSALEAFEGKTEKLPRLLVDSSGCCALMIKPSSASVAVLEGKAHPNRKRSDLVRLPPSVDVSYADAAEIRELLYLPPRHVRQHAVDTPPSHRSFINILYIYPRSLKLEADAQVGSDDLQRAMAYSVRIQLIRSYVDIDGETGQVESFQRALESFHNPAPWAGPQMLGAVYTKVAEMPRGKRSTNYLLQKGIPLRDEIKLRLPQVLDGNFYLHFTLFGLELNDSGQSGQSNFISRDSIAETTIPLTSSSTREANSGVRVTTIIPNGNHRLRIGQFQLQLETRLVSSIHVGDAAVAAALREFPCRDADGKNSSGEDFTELALVPSRSIVGKSSSSSEPIVDMKVPFSTIFSSASENSLFGNFYSLSNMHLSNLVGHSSNIAYLRSLVHDGDRQIYGTDGTSVDPRVLFLMDNFTSFVEVLRKAKICLRRRVSPSRQGFNVDLFIKDFVDSFDETGLSQDVNVANDPPDKVKRELGKEPERTRSSFSLEVSAVEPGISTSQDEPVADFTNDGGGSVKRRSLGDKAGPRWARVATVMGSSEVPFARVVYGASKIDRMRLEAELTHEGGRLTQLFDDDETIATFLTAGNDGPSVQDNGSLDKGRAGSEPIGNEKVHSTENSVAEVPDIPEAGIQDRLGFAKRVRTAAQVMIAPCMAPSLSVTLANTGGDSPLKPRSGSVLSSNDRMREDDDATTENQQYTPQAAVFAGSDDDEECIAAGKLVHTVLRTGAGHVKGLLRALPRVSLVHVTDVPSFESSRHGSFLYAVIMPLWLKSWSEWAAKGTSAITIPPYDPERPHSDLFLSLAGNMDFLLPMCLKSFILRCDSAPMDPHLGRRFLVDEDHMRVFETFVEMLARVLVGKSLYSDNETRDSDMAMIRALSSAKVVLDFLVGLVTVMHPFHISVLLSKFVGTLRECEVETAREKNGSDQFVWDRDSIRLVLCCRQIRIRVIEQLSVIPNFVALNFPLRFKENGSADKPRSTSWTVQCLSPNFRESSDHAPLYPDGTKRLPKSGWLGELLTFEGLSICSLSCEAVVAEAVAQLESTTKGGLGTPMSSADDLRTRPGVALRREDLLKFQSTAIHSLNCVYELLLRRHSMDSRYQTEKARCRIAALFAPAIIDKSVGSVRWLARMETTHKVRSVWLLCFVYVLQEAPEAIIRERLRSYCAAPAFELHKFIRLLRLSTSTFQSVADGSSQTSTKISPWVLQECSNTISATVNMLVDECVYLMSPYPNEEKKISQGVIDLLLHIITAPQSVVTHLRAVGGALHTMNRLGVEQFLESAGPSLQHWVRVILTLLNSTALSVRSIAVDFIISLLGDAFKAMGNIDKITEVFATLIPEVVAREIALYSVNGLVSNFEHLGIAVWPLRRALADIEEANPVDDDRVDPQLSSILSVFCRACQSIIDGVLLELRLKGEQCSVLGAKIHIGNDELSLFDADEESLYEAASFFGPETAPLQRLRWFLTLKRLHEAKGRWVEAAETLILCARTISDSLPHVRKVWRPSRFVLWHDVRRSLWLSSIGESEGRQYRGNTQVMQFADSFLEPPDLLGTAAKHESTTNMLLQPTVRLMCQMLISVTKEAVKNYSREGQMEGLAKLRVEGLLKIVMKALDDHHATTSTKPLRIPVATRRRLVEESAALQEVSMHLNGELTTLSMNLLERTSPESGISGQRERTNSGNPRQLFYVRVLVSGKKPDRFKESTTIPTFLEWDNACICRVPTSVVRSALSRKNDEPILLEDRICQEFGKPLRSALAHECSNSSILFRIGGRAGETTSELESTTYLEVSMVHIGIPPPDAKRRTEKQTFGLGIGARESKRFYYRKSSSSEVDPGLPRSEVAYREVSPELTSNLVELRVAQTFPCALSRQRSLITSEFLSTE